eukprot:366121-Chlamydomonas_euryale.AAC.8
MIAHACLPAGGGRCVPGRLHPLGHASAAESAGGGAGSHGPRGGEVHIGQLLNPPLGAYQHWPRARIRPVNACQDWTNVETRPGSSQHWASVGIGSG